MSFAESRSQALLEADRSAVITNSILLTRRIRELQRRRQALVSRQEQVRAQLPGLGGRTLAAGRHDQRGNPRPGR